MPINLLTNGSFELGESDWNGWTTWRKLTTLTAYHEQKSAQLTARAGLIVNHPHPDLALTAGETYRISGVIKTENLTGEGAYITLQWKKSSGIIREDKLPAKVVLGTTPWTEYAATFVAPAGTERLHLELIVGKGSGIAYFDDIKVEKVNP